jgi:hypothetical protein
MTLSDIPGPRLGVACDKCGRKGSYSVAKLYAERGDLRLTDFLSELTSACPNARSIGWHERALRGSCVERMARSRQAGARAITRSAEARSPLSSLPTFHPAPSQCRAH